MKQCFNLLLRAQIKRWILYLFSKTEDLGDMGDVSAVTAHPVVEKWHLLLLPEVFHGLRSFGASCVLNLSRWDYLIVK